MMIMMVPGLPTNPTAADPQLSQFPPAFIVDLVDGEDHAVLLTAQGLARYVHRYFVRHATLPK